MTDIKQELVTALLKHGQAKLATLWDCSGAEASRRVNGERGITLEQMAAALEMAGATLVVDHNRVCLPRDEFEAMQLLLQRYLEKQTAKR